MVSKDQAIGWIIFLVCVVAIVGYLVTLFGYEPIIQEYIIDLGDVEPKDIQFWLVAIPVMIALVAVLAIGAWIGWTMGTTPPPRPIEEIESEESPTE